MIYKMVSILYVYVHKFDTQSLNKGDFSPEFR